jgi:hypothetical protein
MYSKLFSSILDSSIWLEEPPTKVVWVTLLAAMDQDGFAHFSAMENLARRAVLSIEETAKAVRILEEPDSNSADKEFDGRRIERVPGGWMVLNCRKYHDIATREIAREKVRKRVAKFRHRKRNQIATTKQRNNAVTQLSKKPSENGNATVSPRNSIKRQTHSQNQAEKADDLTAGERAKLMRIHCNVSKKEKEKVGAADNHTKGS